MVLHPATGKLGDDLCQLRLGSEGESVARPTALAALLPNCTDLGFRNRQTSGLGCHLTPCPMEDRWGTKR